MYAGGRDSLRQWIGSSFPPLVLRIGADYSPSNSAIPASPCCVRRSRGYRVGQHLRVSLVLEDVHLAASGTARKPPETIARKVRRSIDSSCRIPAPDRGAIRDLGQPGRVHAGALLTGWEGV
jgi:hypothetical protein